MNAKFFGLRAVIEAAARAANAEEYIHRLFTTKIKNQNGSRHHHENFNRLNVP